MVTWRAEDYLETIFEIEMEGQLPSITELAMRLNLRKATVTVAVQRMTEEGLMLHERYGKIALTRKGLGLALTTFRRHQQMTTLFTQALGIDRPTAERMACSVEHSLTPEGDQRAAAFVSFFAEARKAKAAWLIELEEALARPQRMTIPLAMLPPKRHGEIQSINLSSERRIELAAQGVVVGARLERCSEDEELCVIIRSSGIELQLPPEEGVAVWVVPCATHDTADTTRS